MSDGAPDAPGFRLADAGLHAGVCDAHAVLEAVHSYVMLNRIDGVIGIGAESGPTVTAVTAALGLATSALGGDRHDTNALTSGGRGRPLVRARAGTLHPQPHTVTMWRFSAPLIAVSGIEESNDTKRPPWRTARASR